MVTYYTSIPPDAHLTITVAIVLHVILLTISGSLQIFRLLYSMYMYDNRGLKKQNEKQIHHIPITIINVYNPMLTAHRSVIG